MCDTDQMPENGQQTVEYQRTTDDLVAAHRHIVRGKRLRWAPALYVGLGCFMLLVAWGPAAFLHWSGTGFQVDWWFSIAVSIVTVVGVGVMTWLRRQPRFILKRMMRGASRKLLLGPVRLRLGSSGIEWSDHAGAGLLKWVAVLRIDVRNDYVFFMVGPDLVIPAPRRAFASDRAFEAFADCAQRLRKAAPVYESECPQCKYVLTDDSMGCPECGWRREASST